MPVAPNNPILLAQQQAMMTQVLTQHAAVTRRGRRLHVGNLPPGLNGDALRDLFNTTMRAAQLALDEHPCVNDVQMANAIDAKYAFIELRSVVETNNAMALNGMQLLGRALKISRPNDYAPSPPELDAVIIPPAVSATVTSSAPIGAGNMYGGAGALPRPNLHAGMPPMPPQAGGAAVAAAAAAAAAAASAAPGAPPGACPWPCQRASGAERCRLCRRRRRRCHDGRGDRRASGRTQPLAAALGGGGGGGGGDAQSLLSLSRRARRLHIGNLPTGVGLTADVLKQFFNAALVSASLHDAGIDGGEPIVDCNLGSEGKFGFLEFRTIAECTSCIALSGIELGGKALRVERPRDYAPMAETMTEALREAGLLGNTTIAPHGQDLLSGVAARRRRRRHRRRSGPR